MSRFTLSDLEAIIAARASASGDVSYTRKLLDKGAAHCARKMGEEAVETIIAALDEDHTKLAAESADLIYHLLVLLRARGLSLKDVELILEQRTAMTGLEEKALRPRE